MTDQPLLVIGNKNYSSWSLRPWLLLRHFGVAFDEQVLPLDTERFHSQIGTFSPSRRVPALRHGALKIWDSLAICEYVNEAFLDGRGWPSERAARAVARAVTAEMHSGFQALRNECPMNVRRQFSGHAVSDDARRDIERVRELWTGARERFGAGGDFLFGPFCIADAFFAPVAVRWRTYGLPAGPVERAYIESIYALPAMRQWRAEAEQEAERIEKYERIGA
jgi:glutathione S-transferase